MSSCRICTEPLEGVRSDAAFCSSACRQQAYRQRKREARAEHEALAALAQWLTPNEMSAFRTLGSVVASRNAPLSDSRNAVGTS